MQKTTSTQTHPDACDIITDMLQRVAPLLEKLSDAREKVLATLEKDLRGTWGGDRVYIQRRRGEADHKLHSERNSRILRAYQQGRHIAYMAKAEGLTERRVLQIVGALRTNNTKRSC